MVRLYSNGTDLDLGEFATTLTFSIADIREPDKRNASFSKTLTLPGTKANNLFFENMFEVDVVTQTFNPNLKATTVLSVDGVTQFKGALKLRQVNYLVGGKVTYDCNLIGNLSDFIQTLGNLKLRDLDLSAYDHTYSQANIEASWTPTLGTGYVYPMINYGDSSDLERWYVRYFRPAPFVKTVLDKIASEAGYTYASTFFNTTLFKSLIIPNSLDLIKQSGAQITAGQFAAGRTTEQVIGYTMTDQADPVVLNITTVQSNNDSTAPYFDNDGNYNIVTYKHIPNYNTTGVYFFEAELEGTFVVPASGSGAEEIGIYGVVEIVEEYLGVVTQLNSQQFFTSIIPVSSAGGSFSATASVSFTTDTIQILSGHSYYTRVYAYANAFNPSFTPSAVTTNLHLTDITFRNTSVNTSINIGGTMTLSAGLPDMLQKDFVMGLVKMFNLYIEPDKDDETLLNIEPRDTYYNSTQVDWSAKLATEKDLEIQPMGLLNFKRLSCSYKPDDDFYNKSYKNEYARVYGDYQADIDNDFVNGEYKVETNFAATPLVGSYDNDRIIPAIFKANGNPPVTERVTGIPRILYWGGLKNCEQWKLIGPSITFFDIEIPTYLTQYPYAGHLDDPQAPTLDLSFGIPQKVYYGVNQYISSLTYTDNNLYNTYYSQMISEVTDRDSKLVTGYFWLTPVDILNLDFRKIYRVGSHALRLNKIYDYNPVKSNLTKCEFIKIKDTSTFVSNSEIMNGGIDIVVNARENAPVIDMSTFQDGNVVARPSTTVITGEKNYAGGGLSTWIGGKNNRVHGRASSGVVITGEDNIVQDGASGVVIHGYNNTVGFGAKSLFIQGNRNTIAPNLENISLINSDGQTVTENDVTYFNNTKFIKTKEAVAIYSVELSIPTADVLTLNATPIEIVPAQGVGKGIEVISAILDMAFNSVAYATNTDLQLILDTVSDAQATTTIKNSNSTGRKFVIEPTPASTTAVQITDNAALLVKVSGGNPTAGDSDITIILTYRIHG